MKPHSEISRNSRIEKRLNKTLVLALKKLRIRRATAAVFLVRRADLRKMKARLRGRSHFGEAKARYYKKKGSRELDVLSFAEPRGFPHPESRRKFLGEIYLNENLKSQPQRLQFLLVHGLLHLLGFTHDKKHDTLKMRSLERKLMHKHKVSQHK